MTQSGTGALIAGDLAGTAASFALTSSGNKVGAVGATFGETDDFGLRNVDEPIPMRDVHATILRLMGLDQNRLTYLNAGRFKKLTDIGGRVIDQIVRASG